MIIGYTNLSGFVVLNHVSVKIRIVLIFWVLAVSGGARNLG